jgi:hypothetical protein
VPSGNSVLPLDHSHHVMIFGGARASANHSNGFPVIRRPTNTVVNVGFGAGRMTWLEGEVDAVGRAL